MAAVVTKTSVLVPVRARLVGENRYRKKLEVSLPWGGLYRTVDGKLPQADLEGLDGMPFSQGPLEAAFARLVEAKDKADTRRKVKR